MLNKSFVNLTAALVFGTTALASARVFTYPNQSLFQPNHAKGPAILAGIVAGNGTIAGGTGFSVSHDATGEYTLDVPAGNKFKSCPVVVLTPAGVSGGIPIPDDYDYITCGNQGEVKIQVRIYSRTDGTHQDNAFHFAMIED